MLVSLTSLVADAAKEVKVTLTFQPVVEVSSKRMYLAKIALLKGDSSMVEKLGAIDLGPAPPPGGKLSLAPTMIYAILNQYGVNPEEIRIQNLNQDGVLVKGAGQLVKPERVLPKIEEYIYSQLPYFPEDIQIFQRSNIPDIWIPWGDYHVEVGPYRGSKLWGMVSLPVKIVQNGDEYRRFAVNLEVNIFQKVCVTVDPIQRLSIISANQVEERYLDITRINGEPVLFSKEVIGKQAKRSLSANSIIVKDYLQDQILIKRNDQVTIEVSYGGINIQTRGKALENGAKGQWIWVENLSSGAKVQGLVTGAGTVRVKVN